MAYASWSVVFGEQPSAAKWNILGTNDAAFNNGSGIQPTNNQWIQWNNASAALTNVIKLHSDNYLRLGQIPRQNDNNNTIASAAEDNVLIQYGWVQIPGAVANAITETITFPIAYTAAPVIIVAPLGAKVTTAMTDITNQPTQELTVANVRTPTTTNFIMALTRHDAGNFASGNFYAASWIAIGPKT